MLRDFFPYNHSWVRFALLVVPCSIGQVASVGAQSATTSKEWSTRDASRALTLHDGVTLTLAPGTRLVRLPSVSVPKHLKELAPRALSVELTAGRVDVDIDTSKQPITAVIVRGPRHIAAFAKGGKCSVISSAQGVVAAAVAGTELSVSYSDKWRTLHTGTAFVATRENPAGEIRSLPQRPVVHVDHGLALALGASVSSTLTWSAVADAQEYRVLLEDESRNIREPIPVKQTSLQLPPLAPGRYSATVMATDRYGLDSAASDPVSIRVVGVQLPEGAYVYHGVPQIGREQQIRLTHSDGLEMAYGSGEDFGPVSDGLGVSSGHPLVARLREKGSHDEIMLKLEPRSVRSSIEFLPHGARWPGQSIQVRVRLVGPDGLDLPESISVSLNATVNAKPIDANWEREGGTWTAQIDQPPIAGPWVLRVTARDQMGEVLARDFTEIALPAPCCVPSSRPKYSSRF